MTLSICLIPQFNYPGYVTVYVRLLSVSFELLLFFSKKLNKLLNPEQMSPTAPIPYYGICTRKMTPV